MHQILTGITKKTCNNKKSITNYHQQEQAKPSSFKIMLVEE
jgi:hypothetical protein